MKIIIVKKVKSKQKNKTMELFNSIRHEKDDRKYCTTYKDL